MAPILTLSLVYLMIDSVKSKWAGKFHTLNVTNEVGTTVYQFKFGMGPLQLQKQILSTSQLLIFFAVTVHFNDPLLCSGQKNY